MTPHALLLSAVLILSSLGPVYKYGGAAAAALFAVLVMPALAALQRFLQRERRPVGARTAVGASLAAAAVMLVLFSALYPLSNSGLLGGGSDRDEDIRSSCEAVLAGRSPYGELTYSGHAQLSMPGAILAALPFHAMGQVAYQSFFWLLAWALALRHQWRCAVRALALLWTVIALSPELLRELFTGGTLLTNALSVSTAAYFLAAAVEDGDKPRSYGWAAALGALLSSRPNFLLIAPVLAVFTLRRAGRGQAAKLGALMLAAFAAVNLPFVIADPSHFPRPSEFNVFARLAPTVPATEWLPYLWLLASLVLAARTKSTTASFFFRAAWSQALPAAGLFLLWAATNGANAFSFAGYGLNALFLSVFAFGEGLRDRSRG